MQEILNIRHQDWELSVWAKDNAARQDSLKVMLASRGLQMPRYRLMFSGLSHAPEISVHGITVTGTEPSGADLPEPVFFENKLYDFEFFFRGDQTFPENPLICHRLRAVEESFRYSQRSRSLRGSLNFANDIGWFSLQLRYTGKDGIPASQTVSFEVLPTKMSMAQDLSEIQRRIDQTYPLLRFSFQKKTEFHLGRSRDKHERFPLLWLAHFRELNEELLKAARTVSRAPHTRLIAESSRVRAERLRGKISARQAEKLAAHLQSGEVHHRYLAGRKVLSTDTPENRFIKMVLRRCSRELSAIERTARAGNGKPEAAGRLSETFFDQLQIWKKPYDQLLSQPFFNEIGEFEGLERESQVLHQKAGYAAVYRIWSQMKMYLGFFAGNTAVSMKTVSELYEIWCFLELKSMLEELGFSARQERKSPLSYKGLEFSLKENKGSQYELFRASDKMTIRLIHEPAFGPVKNPSSGEIASWITTQKPDILLEAELHDKRKIRLIFDAKYRIQSNDDSSEDTAGQSGFDRVPDDAINQMHRYRDALIHIDQTGNGWSEKSRPVLAAFALYPGWFDEANQINPYQESIDEIGIGAFPLLPGRPNLWLQQLLQRYFGEPKLIEEYGAAVHDRFYVQEAARIAFSGTYARHYDDLTLIATAAPQAKRNPLYIEKFRNGTAPWYHFPVDSKNPENKYSKKTIPASAHHVMLETRYLGLPVYESESKERSIRFLYEILSVEIKHRNELTEEQAGSVSDNTQLYWLLRLGRSKPLPKAVSTKNIRHFQMFHTLESRLHKADKVEDIERCYPGQVNLPS